MADKAMKKQMTERMADNLPTLRAKLKISQSQLSEMLGVTRQTLTAIESKKRPMTWGTFIACIHVFSQNADTQALLPVLGLDTDGIFVFEKNK